MPIYHLSAKPISRGQGRSATAAAAYRAGELIRDERTGLTHDYSRRGGVAEREVLLPDGAPERWSDRERLWNDAELAESRSNSRTAREVEVALPRELDRGEQWDLVREWAREEFCARGMVADACLHDKGDGNPHAHVMLTTREVDGDGFGAKNRDWNDRAMLQSWREGWQDRCNDALEAHYDRQRTPEREREYVDCRSFAERGIDREPTQHEGPAVRQIENREREACAAEGRPYEPVTQAARENADRRMRNQLRQALERARAAAQRAQERAQRAIERARGGIARPHAGRMRANVDRVRAMVDACDRDGRLTKRCLDAYNGLSRRERGMLHRECGRTENGALERLSELRHEERPYVSREPERGREPGGEGRGRRPMRARELDRAVDDRLARDDRAWGRDGGGWDLGDGRGRW